MKTIKIIKYLILLFSVVYLHISNLNANDKSVSFVTGVGTSHFEAHRMAVNAANAAGMRINQQSSRKSTDGLWHVILKVSSK
jgi:hypothetical protein